MARFYAPLLGMEVTSEGEGGAAIGAGGQPAVYFQQVADYTAPQWPDPAHPQQFHIDVQVADVDVAEEQALRLGATKLPSGGKDFRVYATLRVTRSVSAGNPPGPGTTGEVM